MSAVKRRKVDTALPSTLPKGKKNVAKEESVDAVSKESSLEPATKEAEKSIPEQDEVAITFEDLV
jgi:hypothetical protein